MLRIFAETEADHDEVETLYDLSFAPGRTALSSYRLREGVNPVAELSLTARDDYDVLVGAIRYWPVVIISEPPSPSRRWAALLLGPIAVHPTRQGEGVGAALMKISLQKAAASGWERVVLVGDEPYYRRFGFTRAEAERLTFPPPVNPNRVLALPLIEGGMANVEGVVSRCCLSHQGP